MKKLIPYILVLILGFLYAKECSRKTDPQVITVTRTIPIPPISGWFEPKTDLKPILVREVDSTYKEHYLTAKDSLEQLQMYLDAITIREYKEQFKDSAQEVNVFTKVRGEMLQQTLDYKIFERTIEHKETFEVKEKRNFYFLPQIGSNSERIKGSGSILFQDRKKRLYSIGIDTDGFIMGGYGIKF